MLFLYNLKVFHGENNDIYNLHKYLEILCEHHLLSYFFQFLDYLLKIYKNHLNFI